MCHLLSRALEFLGLIASSRKRLIITQKNRQCVHQNPKRLIVIKVSKSQKQIMTLSILPKKRTEQTQDTILIAFRSIFGRIDLVTFRREGKVTKF